MRGNIQRRPQQSRAKF
jgi:hypothetical protein